MRKCCISFDIVLKRAGAGDTFVNCKSVKTVSSEQK